MDFPFGEIVYRDRRKLIVDPYDPTSTTPGPWTDPDTIELPGAFVASSSSASIPDPVRSQVITTKSLYLSDPAADVLTGDRIRSGSSTYSVDAKPEADRNPFTGWQPVQEIPLKLGEG